MHQKYKQAIEILNLSYKFSLIELKKKYKENLKKYHPDKNKYEENIKIQEIKEAYLILLEYIENYEISFEEKDIKLTPEDYIKQKYENEWKV